MPGAIDQMAAEHSRARRRLHRFEHAGTLIGAPILFARDETGRYVDAAAGKCLKLRDECTGGAAAVPLQSAWNPVRAYSAL